MTTKPANRLFAVFLLGQTFSILFERATASVCATVSLHSFVRSFRTVLCYLSMQAPVFCYSCMICRVGHLMMFMIFRIRSDTKSFSHGLVVPFSDIPL